MIQRPIPNSSHRNNRARWAAIGAAIAVSVSAVGISLADSFVGEPRTAYTPITPCRLADFRPEFQVGPRSAPLGADETVVIDARGAEGECSATDLPDQAVALELNVTAVGATAATFVTVWPDGPRPNASSLNPVPGEPPTPNAVTTPLADGSFRLFNRFGEVDLIVDVVGFYTDENARTIERTMSIPAGSFTFNPINSQVVGSDLRGLQFANVPGSGAWAAIARPPDWDGVSPVVVRVAAQRPTPAFGNVRFVIQLAAGGDGQATGIDFSSSTSSAVAGGFNVRNTVEITIPADEFDDGGWWRFGVLRDDTIGNPFPADLFVEGLTISYQATTFTE